MDRKRPPRYPEREYFAHSGGKNDNIGVEGSIVSCSDKNDPLFCGFTMAYFFATWRNGDFRRPQRGKSTEKWVVFIMPPTSLGGIASENILTWTAYRSGEHKTRGTQGTSGSQMLEMLTKGGVICQQHEGGPESRSAQGRLGKGRGRRPNGGGLEQTSVPRSPAGNSG